MVLLLLKQSDYHNINHNKVVLAALLNAAVGVTLTLSVLHPSTEAFQEALAPKGNHGSSSSDLLYADVCCRVTEHGVGVILFGLSASATLESRGHHFRCHVNIYYNQI